MVVSHLQDQVLSSYTQQQAYHDLALLCSPKSHTWVIGLNAPGWQSQDTQPWPSLSDLVHAITKAILKYLSFSYWFEKWSQTEGSLLPQRSLMPLLSQSQAFPTVVQAKPFDKEFVEGRALDLATGIMNISPTYWVSTRWQASYINTFYFILSKSWQDMHLPFNMLHT